MRTMMLFAPTWGYVISSVAPVRASRDSQGKLASAAYAPTTAISTANV